MAKNYVKINVNIKINNYKDKSHIIISFQVLEAGFCS